MQRTDDWFRQRRGKLTASNMGQALGLTPWGSPKALAKSLRADLEPVDLDKPVPSPAPAPAPAPAKSSAFMGPLVWGTVQEPNGLLEYMTCTSKVVQETGFWQHPHLDWLGGSPDGLVDADGLVEVKCPYTKKVYAAVPVYYYCQVNALMEITGRQWCDLCVWTPTDVKIWHIRANPHAWATLLPHYTAFWAAVCTGAVPPHNGKTLLPQVLEWIAQDAHLLPSHMARGLAFAPATDEPRGDEPHEEPDEEPDDNAPEDVPMPPA
jgi:putative phage-type endonuclease